MAPRGPAVDLGMTPPGWPWTAPRGPVVRLGDRPRRGALAPPSGPAIALGDRPWTAPRGRPVPAPGPAWTPPSGPAIDPRAGTWDAPTGPAVDPPQLRKPATWPAPTGSPEPPPVPAPIPAPVADEIDDEVDEVDVADATDATEDATHELARPATGPIPPRWRAGRRVLAGLGIAVVLARIAAVDLAGIVVDDSITHLQRSGDPLGDGFLFGASRPDAYSVLLAASNGLAGVLGWDHVFGMALVQRLLFVGALGVAVWALRWWAAPLLALLTASTYVIHVDYLLPEGVLIPLSLLTAALLAAVVTGRVTSRAGAFGLLVAITAASFAAALVEPRFVTLLLLAGAAGWILVGDRLVARSTAVAVVGLAVAGVLAVGAFQSREHRDEMATSLPIAELERRQCRGAWRSVFLVQPTNRGVPALADFVNDEDCATLADALSAIEPDPGERARIFTQRVDALFRAAETTRRGQHFDAFLGALGGGRTDSLAATTDAALAAQPGDAIARAAFSTEAAQDGVDAVLDRYNEGLPPAMASARAVFEGTQRPLGDHAPWAGFAAWVSILLLARSLLFAGRHRPAAAAVLVMYGASAAALAYVFDDDARFMLAPLAVVVLGGVLAGRAIFDRYREQTAEAPPVTAS